jgi:hypothetical protein
MAIELQDGARIGAPVIRQQRLGEVAYLAVVRTEQRDRLRRNQSNGEMEPIPNGSDRQGRPRFRQEMVIHALALPGTTMEARLGDEGGVPAAGDRVRLILKARGFGDWIEARRGHRKGKLNVGDVLTLETRWAQQYDQDGNAKGPKIDEAAEQAYRSDEAAQRQQQAIELDGDDDFAEEFGDEEVPF